MKIKKVSYGFKAAPYMDIKLSKPKMSWERPIEEELLRFVRDMASRMEEVANKPNNGLFGTNFMDTDKGIREGANNYAMAYRTVERQILNEIRIRERVKL